MQDVRYETGPDGSWVVHGYNRAKACSSFLSGIAGVWGVPTWAYYVNRGQAVCTFGVRDKDHCLMEFDSARLHQHRAALEGFRTFVRLGDGRIYEPFRTANRYRVDNRMVVHPHALELVEDNHELGLRIRVRYATLAEEDFPALLRVVELTNTGDATLSGEVIDGCPRFITAGMEFMLLKLLPFVSEGYLEVFEREAGSPFIRMKALASDDWQIQTVDSGNFFAAASGSGDARRLLSPIVDQEVVFGEVGDFIAPYRFAEAGFDPACFQGTECQTCSAFVHAPLHLEPGSGERIDALFGSVRHRDRLPAIRQRLLGADFGERKLAAAKRVSDGIRGRCFVRCGVPELEAYIPQTYLDNVLRGGLPLTLPSASSENGKTLCQQGRPTEGWGSGEMGRSPAENAAGGREPRSEARSKRSWGAPEARGGEAPSDRSLFHDRSLRAPEEATKPIPALRASARRRGGHGGRAGPHRPTEPCFPPKMGRRPGGNASEAGEGRPRPWGYAPEARGGSAPSDRILFHVYSRKHGDLERDYNMFSLAATWFSQGNGNFRDVNQNRRHDPWFNPDVGDANVRRFFDLLQLDGYNPLLCTGTRFRVLDPVACRGAIAAAFDAATADAVAAATAEPFDPGSLFLALEDHGAVPAQRERLLAAVLAHSEAFAEAEFVQGYWTDHWIYNFDLLDAFVAIFPERLRDLLLDDPSFTYYDTHVRVLPRSARYVRLADGAIVQAEALDEDGAAKRALIAARDGDPHRVRSAHGHGPVYRCTLLQKILCLLVNKLASIAPSGIGIDMEAGRPGWHDSINGLPGLFGSSTSEVFHLLRVVRFLAATLDDFALDSDFVQSVPEELAVFLDTVILELERWAGSDAEQRDHLYWDCTAAAKELYREATYMGLSGEERPLSGARIARLLELAQQRLEAAITAARDPETGTYATYVRHRPVAWDPVRDDEGQPVAHPRGACVRIDRFEHHLLPAFLEAPTHALRTGWDTGPAASKLYNAIRSGPLYDRELGMYLVSDSIAAEGPGVGRIWAWAPGWFENENVFLHLEHKYLLGCLHAGLIDEFFADLRACALPFQDLERYGRNPFENASFIMSSRHSRPHYRGRGFQPRSSGTTAEVLEMFLVMSFGARPFAWDDGALTLRLQPTLAPWLFTEAPATVERHELDGSAVPVAVPANAYAALFLGHTVVIYRNPGRRPTYGADGVSVRAYALQYADGSCVEVEGPVLRGDAAAAVRRGAVVRIECALA